MGGHANRRKNVPNGVLLDEAPIAKSSLDGSTSSKNSCRKTNPSDAGDINYISLSKALSKALRHRPERLGITLAPDGSVKLSTLVEALNRRGGWPRAIAEADVLHVVEHGTKQRFAVEDGRIRARYGHTLPLAVSYEAATPPDVLYHGTSKASAERIVEEGLLPMGRQKVHLSSDVETAVQVGRRHGGRDVVVLRVDAARASLEGVRFFRGNDTTWLADRVPPTYLSGSVNWE